MNSPAYSWEAAGKVVRNSAKRRRGLLGRAFQVRISG